MARVVLYNLDGWPSCAEAKEFLSQHGVEFEGRGIGEGVSPAEAIMAVIRPARRFFIKAGGAPLVLERLAIPASDETLQRHFIHEDGRMRVPVLLAGEVVVRGFTPSLYREALIAAGLLPR